MTNPQNLSATEATVLRAFQSYFDQNPYKTKLHFDDLIEALDGRLVAGKLKPVVEHLIHLGCLWGSTSNTLELTARGLSSLDAVKLPNENSFSHFCALLLVALADHYKRIKERRLDFDAFDLREVAKLYELSFSHGWIPRAGELFEHRNWATIKRFSEFEESGVISAGLTGPGLLEAERLREELLERGILPPTYPPLDNVEGVKTSTVPSAGTTPVFIGGDSALEGQGNSGSIPASDRFVVIDHNSQSYRETSESIERVRTAVTQANDLFATEGEKLEVLSELSNLQKLFSGETLRIGALKQYTEANGTLPYLYQKAKDGIVGSAAWECLQKIVKFIAECLDFS